MKAIALAGLALLLLGGACSALSRSAEPIATNGVRACSTGERHVFAPAVETVAGYSLMAVTFPEGFSAELRYPSSYAVEQLGVTPYGSAGFLGRGASRDFLTFYGDVEDVLTSLNGGALPPRLASYRGAETNEVGFWRVSHDLDYLAFQFGCWSILVYDYRGTARMTEEERRLWSSSLAGRETPNGFLVLSARAPLRLTPAGEHAGPTLEFGARFPSRRGALTLVRSRCTGTAGELSGGWWCLSGEAIIHATGALRGLRQELELQPRR